MYTAQTLVLCEEDSSEPVKCAQEPLHGQRDVLRGARGSGQARRKSFLSSLGVPAPRSSFLHQVQKKIITT